MMNTFLWLSDSLWWHSTGQDVCFHDDERCSAPSPGHVYSGCGRTGTFTWHKIFNVCGGLVNAGMVMVVKVMVMVVSVCQFSSLAVFAAHLLPHLLFTLFIYIYIYTRELSWSSFMVPSRMTSSRSSWFATHTSTLQSFPWSSLETSLPSPQRYMYMYIPYYIQCNYTLFAFFAW